MSPGQPRRLCTVVNLAFPHLLCSLLARIFICGVEIQMPLGPLPTFVEPPHWPCQKVISLHSFHENHTWGEDPVVFSVGVSKD